MDRIFTPLPSLGAAGVVTAPPLSRTRLKWRRNPKRPLCPVPSNRRASWEKVRRFSRRFSPPDMAEKTVSMSVRR